MRVRHRLLLTMAVIVGLAAVGRAQQRTKNLGLLLGGQQYENQNWQRLDQAVCQRPGDPTLCTTGGPASILQGATAPFACAATTSGLYTDTDCNQLCRCNPGQAKWCRSDTGACLSATDCCVRPTTTTTTTLPTTTTTSTTTSTTSTTTTTTSTTTTTTVITALPSWVPSTLAAWMLDEASGTRVNAQGTSSRDMLVNAGAPTNSTDRMEGTASLSIPANNMALATTDTFASLLSPFSVGCWVKTITGGIGGDGTGAFVMHHWNIAATPGTWQLRRWGAGYALDVKNADSSRSALVTPLSWPGLTNWNHVVATYVSGGTAIAYVNGVQVATQTMGTGTTTANVLYLSNNFDFNGGLDECWLTATQLSPAAICRICSCGIRGEQCTCSGTAFVSTGRNATTCGTCALPADCSVATPP